MTINGTHIAHLTNRYELIEGFWYRKAWAVEPDGSLSQVFVLRELVES